MLHFDTVHTESFWLSFAEYGSIGLVNIAFLRCLCPLQCTEVPVSSQWGSAGYYYPTQIAQYGLSHYSKYIAERRLSETKPPSPRQSTVVFTAADADARSPMTGGGWRRSAATSVLRRAYDSVLQRKVYQFKTPGESDKFFMYKHEILVTNPRTLYFFLSSNPKLLSH